MADPLNLTLPLSLYIHLPWCLEKCPYCDFNSHKLKHDLPEQAYITSLIQDLEHALPLVWGRTLQTIFIGGGTPSLFSGSAIDYLLSQIRARLKLSPQAEITLEANPGAVENQFIAEYRAAGINRISLGIQSFNDEHLQRLGRIHSAAEAQQAIAKVATYFDNFNLDLMYGLPGQSSAQAMADCAMAISFKPTHISAYNLTIEPNTHFAKFPPAELPDNDLCYAMQDQITSLLSAHDYRHYEISAFARNGYAARHNLNYWQFGDYLGIGAGAHSKLSFHDRIIRQVRAKHPQDYMQRTAQHTHISQESTLTAAELPLEFMLNALRLTDGFANTLFNQTTGLTLSTVLPQLLQAQQRGLLKLTPQQIIPTSLGSDFLNDLLSLFIA